MFKFIAGIFGYALNIIYNIVNNYGVAIIIFTVLLKIIMLPISINQQKTMKKNAKIQEKVKDIQEKFANDQARQSQELMELYKRENMNPFGGCLTTIVQFILILSVFYLVSRPLTYMKHIEPELIDGYTNELTQESNQNINYKEIAIIKQFSESDEKVRINMNFLGLDLSDIPSQNYHNWKVYIIPVLYVFTSIVSTRLTTSMTQTTNNKNDKKENITANDKDKDLVKKEDDEEDAMAEMNKQMGLMVPAMSVMIALVAPLGLALYWLVSNLLSLAERFIILKMFEDKEEE